MKNRALVDLSLVSYNRVHELIAVYNCHLVCDSVPGLFVFSDHYYILRGKLYHKLICDSH